GRHCADGLGGVDRHDAAGGVQPRKDDCEVDLREAAASPPSRKETMNEPYDSTPLGRTFRPRSQEVAWCPSRRSGCRSCSPPYSSSSPAPSFTWCSGTTRATC